MISNAARGLLQDYEINRDKFRPANPQNDGRWVSEVSIPAYYIGDGAIDLNQYFERARHQARMEAARKLAEQVCDGGLYGVRLRENLVQSFDQIVLQLSWEVRASQTMQMIEYDYPTATVKPADPTVTAVIHRNNGTALVVCVFCSSTNRAESPVCCRCGAPLGSALINGIIRI